MSLAIGILQQTALAFSLFNINRMATEIHPVSQSVSQSSYLCFLTVVLAAGMCAAPGENRGRDLIDFLKIKYTTWGN